MTQISIRFPKKKKKSLKKELDSIWAREFNFSITFGVLETIEKKETIFQLSSFVEFLMARAPFTQQQLNIRTHTIKEGTKMKEDEKKHKKIEIVKTTYDCECKCVYVSWAIEKRKKNQQKLNNITCGQRKSFESTKSIIWHWLSKRLE